LQGIAFLNRAVDEWAFVTANPLGSQGGKLETTGDENDRHPCNLTPWEPIHPDVVVNWGLPDCDCPGGQ